jgi:A/G-specific adenine glycosylase
VLLVRRPGKGLLGGMLGLPTGAWTEEPRPGDGAPAAANWSEAGSIDHVFTHFALNLRLLCAETATPGPDHPGQIWWPVETIGEAGLPTLFARAAARGLEWRTGLRLPARAAA